MDRQQISGNGVKIQTTFHEIYQYSNQIQYNSQNVQNTTGSNTKSDTNRPIKTGVTNLRCYGNILIVLIGLFIDSTMVTTDDGI